MYVLLLLQVYNMNRDNQNEASKIYRNKTADSPSVTVGCLFCTPPANMFTHIHYTYTYTSENLAVCSSDRFCLTSVAQLDVIGFNVIKKFIYAIETRGTTPSCPSLCLCDTYSMKNNNSEKNCGSVMLLSVLV